MLWPRHSTFNEPGLVVQPGGDDIHFVPVHFVILRDQPFMLRPHFGAFCDLPVRALDAVTQSNRLDTAILVAAQVFIAIGLE